MSEPFVPPAPQPPKAGNGLAVAALVLGILGAVLCLIPIVNVFALILGIIALPLGIVGWVGAKKGARSGLGISIAGTVLAGLTIFGFVASYVLLAAAADTFVKETNKVSSQVDKEVDKASGKATNTVLKNDLDLKLGKFTATKDDLGLDTTVMVVDVTNKSAKKQSFDFQVEAVDATGSRIADDTGMVSDLAPGQHTKVKLFELVDSGQVASLKQATFKVIEASAY